MRSRRRSTSQRNSRPGLAAAAARASASSRWASAFRTSSLTASGFQPPTIVRQCLDCALQDAPLCGQPLDCLTLTGVALRPIGLESFAFGLQPGSFGDPLSGLLRTSLVFQALGLELRLLGLQLRPLPLQAGQNLLDVPTVPLELRFRLHELSLASVDGLSIGIELPEAAGHHVVGVIHSMQVEGQLRCARQPPRP